MQVRAPTKAEVAEMRKLVGKVVDPAISKSGAPGGKPDKPKVKLYKPFGGSLEIKRYTPFTPEEGVKIVKLLRAHGYVYSHSPHFFDEYLRKPYHTASFSAMVKRVLDEEIAMDLQEAVDLKKKDRVHFDVEGPRAGLWQVTHVPTGDENYTFQRVGKKGKLLRGTRNMMGVTQKNLADLMRRGTATMVESDWGAKPMGYFDEKAGLTEGFPASLTLIHGGQFYGSGADKVYAAPLGNLGKSVADLAKRLTSIGNRHPDYVVGETRGGLFAVLFKGKRIASDLTLDQIVPQIEYDITERRKHPEWYAQFGS
jgi:hypothetical protein